MHRRNMLAALFGSTGAVIGAAMAPARAAPLKQDSAAAPDAAKVVYHLDELDKVDFVLGNIANHYKGMGGPDKVTIALVIHGPALKAFHAKSANPDMTRRTGEMTKSGLQLSACINTMHGQNVTVADLLPGFAVADKGGVVRIAELQAQGYAYLRP
jgi:intracellular sulfur oxidation DsrE/DsrF family protein